MSRDKNGKLVECDILFHNSNLFDLQGNEYDVFSHKLICLNHNYIKNTTPQGYKDWLNLVNESIKHPDEPNVNFNNEGVKKVTEIIDYLQLSAEEVTENKNRNAAEIAKILYKEESERIVKMEGKIEGKAEGKIEGKMEGKIEIAKNMIQKCLDNQLISEITGLTLSEIEKLR